MHNKIKNILEFATKRLLSVCKHKDQASQEAWWLIEHITKQKKNILLLNNYMLSKHQYEHLEKALQERIENNKPLQYIIGDVPFLNCTIKVKPPILIPRPETEEWTNWLIEKIQQECTQQEQDSLNIADICTGSGCIAIGLAHALPKAKILASDNNVDAVILTNENIKLNNCPNITSIQSNLFDSLYNLKHMFDIIVSNPPYISETDWQNLDPTVREWEDKNALSAPNEGLALYERIIKQAHEFLNPNSILTGRNVPRMVLEIGHEQAQAVTKLLNNAGYANITTHQDLEGKDRWVSTSGLSV